MLLGMQEVPIHYSTKTMCVTASEKDDGALEEGGGVGWGVGWGGGGGG